MGLYRDGVLRRAAAVLFGAPDRVEFDMRYCPDQPVTRAQMALFFARALS